jgi:phosphinothricin acetyltransferase
MQSPIEVIRAFCAACSEDKSARELAEFFTDDAVYHNIPLDPVTGKDDIENTIATFIRQAASGDLDAVAAIFGHYVTSSVITFEVTPPSAQDWRRTRDDLAARGLPFLVCECDRQMVGYAYAAPWRSKPAYRHTVESTIYLAPNRTGQGLGRRLLCALQAHCAHAGVGQMIAVIADSGNPASIALHHACGFIDAGRLRNAGRKHGRLVDTLLMQHDLTGERAA